VQQNEHHKPTVTIAQMLREPLFDMMLLCGFFAALSLTFLDPLLGPFLQAEWGWSVSMVGLCFGLTGLVYAIITPIAG
jgi:hypothetical protein